MSTEDQGIGAAIGAAIIGAGAALGQLIRRRRNPRLLPTPSSIDVRLGVVAERVSHLEQELENMKYDVSQKIDRLSENVDELAKGAAATAALLPEIRAQIAELRQDLRDQRRTNT